MADIGSAVRRHETFRAGVWRLIFWVLEVVLSIGECLSNVDDDVWNAFHCDEVDVFAVHEGYLSLMWVLADEPAELTEWSVRDQQGPRMRKLGFCM